MGSYTKTERQRGLKYANELAALAAAAPDGFSKSRVYRAVNEIQKTFGFTDEAKRQMICHFLRQGCATYDNLARETELRKVDIIKIVEQMEREGTVRLTPMAASTGGRPATHISLIGPQADFVPPKI